jgi:hypothetical protein
MSVATFKYSLSQINDIILEGFEYEIPDNVIQMINLLSKEMGLTNQIKTNLFIKQKKKTISNSNSNSSNISFRNKNNEDWSSVLKFDITTIDKKTGIEHDMNQIKLNFNKLTDKTYLDIREKIIIQIGILENSIYNDTDMEKISKEIYSLASSNKFYSTLFANLYAELLTKFKWLNKVFNLQIQHKMDIYNNITYISPEENYDEYCKNNLINDKRRANTLFLLNLAKNGFINKTIVLELINNLLIIILDMIQKDGYKCQVDELVENLSLLFDKAFINDIEEDSDYDEDDFLIDGKTFNEIITTLSKSKSSNYKSLTNKSIFKFMDLIE